MNRCAYLAVLLLSGCASAVWTQPGKTTEDRKRDLYECERDAAPLRSTEVPSKGMRRRCMESKGWRLEKQ